MKYIIYRRVSTDKQEIKTQDELCRERIKQIHKGENEPGILVFEDDDVSSTKIKMAKRKGLQEMLKSVCKGDIVVVYSLSRLARKVTELPLICEEIRDKGGDVISLSEPLTAPWFLGLIAGMAQKEVEDLSKKTKDRLQSKIKSGERAGTIPYGFQLADDLRFSEKFPEGRKYKLIPNEHEQKGLQLMFELFDKGMSFRLIAERMKAEGYYTRTGKPIPHMSVYKILARNGKVRVNPFRELEENRKYFPQSK